MSMQTQRPSRCGNLAQLYCGKLLPLQVLQSQAGFYIGTADDGWTQRDSP